MNHVLTLLSTKLTHKLTQQEIAEIYAHLVLHLPQSGEGASEHAELLDGFLARAVGASTLDSYAEALFKDCEHVFGVLKTTYFTYVDVWKTPGTFTEVMSAKLLYQVHVFVILKLPSDKKLSLILPLNV